MGLGARWGETAVALLAIATSLAAQPTPTQPPRINAVLNSASYIPPPLPGSAIAQGSIFSVFGAGLGPPGDALIQATDFPLPVTLGGTSIRVSSGGTEVNAFLIFAAAGQLAAILPSNTPVGRATARVTYNGTPSEPFAFDVVRNAPGLYTLNSTGTGPAAITATSGAFEPITHRNAALDGETLSAWATGLTALDGRADSTPAGLFDPPLTVEVIVGGRRAANVRYRGRAPTLAGLDQIVFDLPPGLPRGCAVSLVLRVSSAAGAGVLSNFTTIAIGGDRRTCSDPNGFTESDLATAASFGALRLGTIVLKRSRTKILSQGLPADERTDSGSAQFARFDADSLLRSNRALGLATVSPGSCVVFPFAGAEQPPQDPMLPQSLSNAGAAISVTNPAGTSRQIARTAGAYATTFGTAVTAIGVPAAPAQAFLDPGNYFLAGPGGADIGAFTTSLSLPPPFTAPTLDSFTAVQRGAGLRVAWTLPAASAAVADAANQIVHIGGSSLRTGPTAGAEFLCAELAGAGQFTVPPEVLLSLPASGTRQETPLGHIRVSVSPVSTRHRFSALGVDVGVVSYVLEELRTVAYQ